MRALFPRPTAGAPHNVPRQPSSPVATVATLHRLRGAASNLGLSRLNHRLERLENAARDEFLPTEEEIEKTQSILRLTISASESW